MIATSDQEPVTVLVARFHAFGDVLLTSPLVETLARGARVASVDLLTSSDFGDPLAASPWVRRVFSSRRQDHVAAVLRREYDVLLDLHARSVPLAQRLEDLIGEVKATTRAGIDAPNGIARHPTSVPHRRYDEHAVDCYARCAGELIDRPLASGVLRIRPSAIEEARAAFMRDAVVVAPGARYAWKRWPSAHYARLIDLLAERSVSSVLVGHPSDEPIVAAVSGASRSRPTVVLSADMLRIAAIMGAIGRAVANNSGMAHLAQAAGARVVCVHSHTLPVMWRPWGRHHADITGDDDECACMGMSEFERAAPCGKRIEPAVVADAVFALPQ